MNNYNIISNELNYLKSKENLYLSYYSPLENIKSGKRHVYYNDMVKDFTEDINLYGFSPFIPCT